MNIYKYSDGRFYPYALRDSYQTANIWPEAGVDVSEDICSEYSAEPPAGKTCTTDADGMPCWGDIPPLTPEEETAKAEQLKSVLLSNARSAISLWQTELQLGIINDENKVHLISWIKYIQALQDVETAKAPDISWPAQPE